MTAQTEDQRLSNLIRAWAMLETILSAGAHPRDRVFIIDTLAQDIAARLHVLIIDGDGAGGIVTLAELCGDAADEQAFLLRQFTTGNRARSGGGASPFIEIERS